MFQKKVKNIKGFLWELIVAFGRKILFDLNFKPKKFKKNPDILFSILSTSWVSYTHKDGRKYKDDIRIGSVINQSKKEFDNILCLDLDAVIQKSNVAKEKDSIDDWVFLEQFMRYRDIFYSIYLFLIKFVDGTIDDRYEQYFQLSKRDIYDGLFRLPLAENILKSVKPRCLLLSSTKYKYIRELIFIAKKEKITSFSLQIGIIPKVHISKDRTKKDLLPDYALVFSENEYNLLTKEGNYDPKMVKITGSPRFDIYFYKDKIYSTDDFIKRYNIPSNHKIVLWTTQCLSKLMSDKENILNFNTVFETMSQIDNTTLLIKQHPNEGEKYTRMIKDILKNYDTNLRLVPKNSEINELLSVCDLLITKDSATALEAMALKKHILILNLSGNPDRVDFVDKGVALGVYRKEELKGTIEKLLKDNSILTENRKKYIEKYLYRIDGKATERVINFIKQNID